MERVLDKNDYSEIFKLQNDETLHKLRGVSAVSLDRFSLSKFLGKYRKASGMIRDKKENAFERDLLSILSKRTLIENYTLWERLLEIMIVNDRLDSYGKLAKNMFAAIEAYHFPNPALISKTRYEHAALLLTLRAAICRTSALCWGEKIDKVLNNIQKKAQDLFPSKANLFSGESLTGMRAAYCQSRMVNKYVLSLPISWLDHSAISNSEGKAINLCHLESFVENANWKASSEDYIYFPYMVTPQEIAYALACKNIAMGKPLTSADTQWKNIKEQYLKWNYGFDDVDESENKFDEVHAKLMPDVGNYLDKPCYAISITSPASKRIKIAIGNARLYKENFKLALTGKQNRTYARYRQVSLLLKEAIHSKVDLLVLPESYGMAAGCLTPMCQQPNCACDRS